MSTRIRKTTNPRQVIRLRRKSRIRKKILLHLGEVARLVVYRSNKYLYAQLIDDAKGVTLAQANTKEDGFTKLSSKKNVDAARELGKLIGERAKAVKVERVLFDRNGYDYHGRVKAVAEGAREAGLRF
jgi:large subunit ribosomal protein L18